MGVHGRALDVVAPDPTPEGVTCQSESAAGTVVTADLPDLQNSGVHAVETQLQAMLADMRAQAQGGSVQRTVEEPAGWYSPRPPVRNPLLPKMGFRAEGSSRENERPVREYKQKEHRDARQAMLNRIRDII